MHPLPTLVLNAYLISRAVLVRLAAMIGVLMTRSKSWDGEFHASLVNLLLVIEVPASAIQVDTCRWVRLIPNGASKQCCILKKIDLPSGSGDSDQVRKKSNTGNNRRHSTTDVPSFEWFGYSFDEVGD